jgi:hypothetical protein
MFHMRQRWGAAVWRAQTQVLLGRLKYALPGWEEAESRRAADTATRRRRPVGGHRTPVGLATAKGLAEIAAGVLGTAATWVASTGSRAAGGEVQTPRLAGACERQGRVFGGGALRCFAASESPFQKKPQNLACINRAPLQTLPRQLQAALQQLPHRVLVRAPSSATCTAKIPWSAPTASTA